MNGFDRKEAGNICGCLKKKFASSGSDNVFMQAFASDIEIGKEKALKKSDLSTIAQMLLDEEVDMPIEEELDAEIGDELTPVEETVDVPEETVTIEVSLETAEELSAAVSTAVSEPVEEVELDVDLDAPVMDEAIEVSEQNIPEEEELETVMAMQTHKLRRVGEDVVKLAGKPTQVKDIEGNVEAGVPRSKATMGQEGADNIDVPMAKPSVPRGKATMGKEGPDNIDKPAGLPEVAVDSSYMGQEKNNQSDMPAINNEIKGTVIAKGDKAQKQAKKMQEIDSVEDNVEAGVPRSKATIGEEGADNIDVPMAKPSVPRGNAEMGEEGADNINPKADGPDVPVDNSYMGKEKETQSGMPGMNSQMLKNVQQETRKDVQMHRIAEARKMKAVEVAAKLLATGRIVEAAYENVITALASFEIDKISSVAENMYPKKIKTSSVETKDMGYSGPAIVLESEKIETGKSSASELEDKIASHLMKRWTREG